MAVFILNRAPTKALKGKTPFEAWYGWKSSVSFLQTFDCIGHVRKTKSILTKLEDRSTPMVLLGYAEGIKAYRLYDPHGGKVLVLRDVVFDEKAAWDWDSSGMREAGGFTSTFVIEPWSSMLVETLERRCRPLQQRSRALLGQCRALR